ncbi:hypothetical protein, partial [Streptomyces dysideae]|uniref:hypothetical protein n=1 Tax=Streptomyces dysideae TaxID=909626 RepID=UPI001F2F6FE3
LGWAVHGPSLRAVTCSGDGVHRRRRRSGVPGAVDGDALDRAVAAYPADRHHATGQHHEGIVGVRTRSVRSRRNCTRPSMG